MTPLFGLILAGGESRRMGAEKAMMNFHGIPQWRWCEMLLATVCERVYLSCRLVQKRRWRLDVPTVLDAGVSQGPASGILAAHQLHPDVAWLVVACDLVGCREVDLRLLVDNRALDQWATCYRDPTSGGPEPLLAIWEPRGLLELGRSVAKGMRSPRALLDLSSHSLVPSDPHILKSANSPEDIEAIFPRRLASETTDIV